MPMQRYHHVKNVIRYLGLAIICGLMLPAASLAASSYVEPFDKTASGIDVPRIIMINDRNMRVALITYGATITSLEVPDRDGKSRNIVLSLPDMASYHRTERRWAGIIGRYAGRIDKARYSLDGKTHMLEPGRNGVTLHGGSNGYDKRLWEYRLHSDAVSQSVTFTLQSPDGDQGFSGAMKLDVTYQLMRDANELRIEYSAAATAPTIVNFTNHAFFNLAGAGNGTVRDHELTLMAKKYVETDDRKIPTGRFLPVKSTPLDFRKPALIGTYVSGDHPMMALSKGFDHSYVLGNKPSQRPRTAAVVRDARSGRMMTILTTEPGLQFNSGNGFEGKEVGSEGAAYPIYAGFALEPQHHHDSPNRPNFPSTRLDPVKPFTSVTIYRFSAE
jgi:aldose 1-epimerase